MALTTLASLLLELAVTRIFSVVFYYHFAFLAISIALFGLGAGGLLSYLLLDSPRIFRALGWLAAAAAPVVLLSLVFLLTQSADLTGPVLVAVYISAAAPFVLAGAITSSVISESAEFVHRVYFFDLLGAAMGCLFLIPLLENLGAVNAVLTAGALFACSSLVWFSLDGTRAGLIAGGCLAVAAVVGVALNYDGALLDVEYAKGAALRQEDFVKWNSFSRVGMLPPDGNGFRDIIIDADADTSIAAFDLEHVKPALAEALRHRGPGFPYLLRPAAKTLIIGAGGGIDVARAIFSGSRDVTAVEINPIIANTIMRERFPEYSHGLYLRPDVHVHVEDGRGFVRRSHENFEVIQATLVDTWASTAAGAFALTENNLYTTDAFRDYLGHLTGTGLVAFTRWGFEPPRESLRLVSLAMEALMEMGERQPWRNVIVLRSEAERLRDVGALDTILVSRKPFSADDLARTFIEAKDARYELLYRPGDNANANPFQRLLRNRHPGEYAKQYAYDISPVSDDRPFFFFTLQTRDIFDLNSLMASTSMDYKIQKAVPLLFEVTGVSVFATLLILLIPPLVLRTSLPRERGARGFLWYFACLGVGYILVQVALIQKFVLLLGHPAYALTVVIFAMLVSSGLGSFFSRVVVGESNARWRAVLLLSGVLIAMLALTLAPLTTAAVSWSLRAKVLLAVFVVAPAGFLMGIPFPTGLARIRKYYPSAVRWAWSVNAASSVMGSAAAVVLGIYLGLRIALLAGAIFYLCAMALTLLADREPVKTRAI